MDGEKVMFQNFETLSTASLYLGSVCLVWIIYDTIKIYTDLSSVIFLYTAGCLLVDRNYVRTPQRFIHATARRHARQLISSLIQYKTSYWNESHGKS